MPGPLERGAHRAGAGKNRLFFQQAVLSAFGLVCGARAPRERRSPGGRWKDPSRTWAISYSKERRSPGWRWKDPSRTWAISYSKERRSPGWRCKDPSRTRTFFSFTAGGGKIRLGDDPSRVEEMNSQKALANENDPHPGGIEPAVSRLRSCRASTN